MNQGQDKNQRLGSLYEANRTDIYFYLYRSTSDQEVALDVTQDAFLNFCRHYDTRPLPTDLECRMILFRIARNLLISRARSFHEKRVAASEDLDREPSGSPSPLAELEDAEVQATLDRLLGRIENEHREALLLRYDQGLSLSEMGVILEVSVSAVSRRLKKAEAALLAQSRNDKVDLAVFLSLVLFLLRPEAKPRPR